MQTVALTSQSLVLGVDGGNMILKGLLYHLHHIHTDVPQHNNLTGLRNRTLFVSAWLTLNVPFSSDTVTVSVVLNTPNTH